MGFLSCVLKKDKEESFSDLTSFSLTPFYMS